MSEQNCPCGLGLYARCCQPLHLGAAAASAEQLMRSRYSAFALQQIDYLLATTALGQQSALDQEAIAAWSKANHWLQLEVIAADEKIDKLHAQVEFKAHFQPRKQQDATQSHDRKQDALQLQAQQHHEVSYFVQHAGRWYFLDPTTDQQLGMKKPCVCGSGKKFKLCCAEYIT